MPFWLKLYPRKSIPPLDCPWGEWVGESIPPVEKVSENSMGESIPPVDSPLGEWVGELIPLVEKANNKPMQAGWASKLEQAERLWEEYDKLPKGAKNCERGVQIKAELLPIHEEAYKELDRVRDRSKSDSVKKTHESKKIHESFDQVFTT